MKIQYLNPENAPNPPEGWRWKTALCKPETIYDWRSWCHYKYSCSVFSGFQDHWSFITQADLPWDYFFDFDGTGLDYADPFYRRGVEKAAKEGKVIQFNATENPCDRDCNGWIVWNAKDEQLDWGSFNYRIHPCHAAEYGIPVPGENSPTIPETVESMVKIAGGCIAALTVGDAPTKQTDLDSVDYWRKRQPEVRMQWAQNPEMERDRFRIEAQGWVWVPIVGRFQEMWDNQLIYRPRPVVLTTEQVDDRDFERWYLENTHPSKIQDAMRIAFREARRTLREKGRVK